jgi:hypothetical protein
MACARASVLLSLCLCHLTAWGASSVESRTSCPGLCRAPAGYRVTASGANLELCPPNHYQTGASRACTRCPWPSTFSEDGGLKDEAECPCRPGYVRIQGACTACELGEYKRTPGDGACEICPEGATTLQTASVDASACVCEPGYERVGELCQRVPCPDNSVLVLGHVWPDASCQCDAGFESQWLNGSLVCAACPDGQFKDAVGNARCAGCGPHTISSLPRANRTACLCAPGYDSGPLDSPDVLGGSCVPECGPGTHGRHGSCSPCPSGHFKPAAGPECSACPPPRTSSAPGTALQAGCSCPRATLEADPGDMAVIERLGPWLDEGAGSISALQALELPASAGRSLWRLSASGGHRSLTVTVGGRLVYECGRGSCPSETAINLQGMRGRVNATSTGGGETQLTLLWRTRRAVVLAAGAASSAGVASSAGAVAGESAGASAGTSAGAPAWWPAAAPQAEAWAAARRLRPGAAVFRARDIFSTAVAACVPCPAGLRCA